MPNGKLVYKYTDGGDMNFFKCKKLAVPENMEVSVALTGPSRRLALWSSCSTGQSMFLYFKQLNRKGRNGDGPLPAAPPGVWVLWEPLAGLLGPRQLWWEI